MEKLKRILALLALAVLCMATSYQAPTSDSQFFIFGMGLFLAFCVPVFELDEYLNRNRNNK